MRKTILVGLVVLGMILGTKIVQATDVSGDVSGNWTLAGSPYVVVANATVTSGSILTINPGVTVRFATETFLICYGTLNAVGAPDDTITLTSDQATHTAGYWNGIKLSGSGTNGSQISYCDIGCAEQAIYLENVSGIVITHNYIYDNKGDDEGWPGEVGCGIYLSSSQNNTISGNIISQNTGGQGGTGGR